MGSSQHGEGLAHFCMMVIGIGYLFPISAIWAAFDYWKMLFPTTNIEFLVTGVYQIGSVVTVAVLSVSKSVSLGPRVLGGFVGQFICLAAIFAFRWLVLPSNVLLELLLIIVILCSVATGFLDSALLALCSQYSPTMQQYLQIGIGFGTLVSVLYRDATKLLMPGDIIDATSMYFSVALVTVIICLGCYRVLMSLPCSSHVRKSEALAEPLLPKAQASISPPPAPWLQVASETGAPPASPHPMTCGFVPVSPCDSGPVGVRTESEDNGRERMGAVLQSDFSTVLGLVWKNQSVVFLNFVLTTICYPGIITSIPCRQYKALEQGHWFQILLLTTFTSFDIVSRFLTHMRFGITHSNIWITVVVRSLLFPFVLWCAMSDNASDLCGFAAVAAFGFLNGFCDSLALIVINEIPAMTDEQRKTCGRISAFSVNSGLCLGSLLAAGLAAGLGLGA